MDPILMGLIGLALAIGGSSLSAAFTIIICGTALAGISTEKPELVSRLIITVVLGEALAIYGLLIGFMILGKVPDITTVDSASKALISGIIIAIATVSAGAGISYSGTSLIAATAEKPDSYSSNIISLVLSEALAIYGLLMAFMVIGLI